MTGVQELSLKPLLNQVASSAPVVGTRSRPDAPAATSVVGVLVVNRPLAALAAFSLLFVVYLTVGGVFRIVASFTLRVPGAVWLALSGLVSVALGVWLFVEFPQTVTWLLGTVVGVDLVFHGMSWIVLALGVKNSLRSGSSS